MGDIYQGWAAEFFLKMQVLMLAKKVPGRPVLLGVSR